ncbi:unnamed protein product [Arctia plantaginis]|uniref:Uncharacterized protein n=1 Tax=Arctia plantaginis TaxID=874455 RepID=A0A8S0YT37_ARCPL|nr:unnamed protein product [Arctia plantaginis]CAB3232281.1 unnamed protein product [Arctia plantaginis]
MEITSLDTDLATHVSQGTEDATKWNECLSPAVFYLMHYYFFENSSRFSVNVDPTSKEGKIFSQICKFGHLFQAWKTIQIGSGLLANNGINYTRLEWVDEHSASMNTMTREW